MYPPSRRPVLSLLVLSLLLLMLLVGCGDDGTANDSETAVPTAAESASEPTEPTEAIPDRSVAPTVTDDSSPTATAPLTDTVTSDTVTSDTVTSDTVTSDTVTNTLIATASATEAATATSTATLTATSTVTVATTTGNVLVPTDTPAESSPATPASATEAGALLNSLFLQTVSAAAIDQESQFFYPASNFTEAAYDVDIYRMTVQSSTETGDPIDLQADLYIPRVETATALPILGYAPGTTGLGDACAPSEEYRLGRSWGSYRAHMLSYAGQGFIGVMPDGMSYDDPERPHEYFIAELEAHTLLDAVRGALALLADPAIDVAAEPQDALFVAGYSNGGHTAFAAKDFAETYAPELPLRGVISHGATTNVETLMIESPVFTPYLIYAYEYYYGSDVITAGQVLAESWLATFAQDVNTKCVDEMFAYYSNDPLAMYRPDFRSALENGELGARMPLFKTVLDANYAGTFGGFDVPVAFFQGSADATVTPRAQQQFARDLCAQGQPVTYVTLPTVRHVNTRQASFLASIEWMRTIAAGNAPVDDCTTLAE